MAEFRWRDGDDGKEMKGTNYPTDFRGGGKVEFGKKREVE